LKTGQRIKESKTIRSDSFMVDEGEKPVVKYGSINLSKEFNEFVKKNRKLLQALADN